MKRYLIALSLLLIAASLAAQTNAGVDPIVLIDRILQVQSEQRSQIQDITFDAILIEGDLKDDSLYEDKRFEKKIFIKYIGDSALFREDYLACYDEGEQQNEKDCAEAALKKFEKKKKRGSLDISHDLLKAFQADQREKYDITYKGVAEEPIGQYRCHLFEVRAKEGDPDLINGDYYFEADGFNPVLIEFTPSKLAGNLAFKLKKLDMTLTYSPTADGLWLPSQFNIVGKGKVIFLFGVNFAGQENYSNPVINSGLKLKSFSGEEK